MVYAYINPEGNPIILKSADPYKVYTKEVNYEVWADEIPIFKTRLKREAKETIEDWKRVDKKNDESHSYKIIKLDKPKKKKRRCGLEGI